MAALYSRIAPYITPAVFWPFLCLTGIICFFFYYWYAMSPRQGTLEWVSMASRPKRAFTFSRKRHPMQRKDALPLLALTVVYAATAFFQLGSFTNPQAFCQLGKEERVTVALNQETDLSRILYYPGLNTGTYTLEVSTDADHWRSLWYREDTGFYWADGEGYDPAPSLSHKYSEMFKWLEITPVERIPVKYLRLTGHPDGGKDWLELGELALYDANGKLLSAQGFSYMDEKAASLFDEQSTVPAAPNWYNSSYFDEIYHPRTAYENIRGVYPYEVTHPPLGKLIMSLSIRIFGMTPFGWRFAGTLFGVGMLPILYIFLKNLFGKTAIATCGTALFAFDFMHLTQTRIGTIDTYGVFFILAMYFFMYRYLTVPPGSSFRAGALNLFLSGLMWGLGAASKWTVIYGAVGLAILYFVGFYFKCRDWPSGEGAPRLGPWAAKTLLFAVLCFVAIPAVIYTLSYIPYAQATGDPSLQNVVREMWDNQISMFTYHEGVNQPHGYSSRWYQWIVDGRPILYYLDTTQEAASGIKTAFGAFNNPLVSWAGLFAILACAVQAVRRRCAKALFIVVGYLSQLVPWMFIFRTTFAYHYFPSTLFLALALAYLMNDLMNRQARGWRLAVYGFTGSAAVLYAAFYPVLIGLAVPTWYTNNFLRWIPGAWPF